MMLKRYDTPVFDAAKVEVKVNFLQKISVGSIAVLSHATVLANTSFFDATFDTTDYSIITFTKNQTVTTSTIATGGNPGSALQVQIDEAPILQSRSATYILNTSFVYHPKTSGSVESISFSLDKLVSSNFSWSNNSAILLISQGGNYYASTIGLPSTSNTFLTGYGNALTSTGFWKVTDLASFTLDRTLHPDFRAKQCSSGYLLAGSPPELPTFDTT